MPEPARAFCVEIPRRICKGTPLPLFGRPKGDIDECLVKLSLSLSLAAGSAACETVDGLNAGGGLVVACRSVVCPTGRRVACDPNFWAGDAQFQK